MQTKTDIQPEAGDVIVVHGHSTGDPGRTGVILEVLNPASGHEHYRVRWDEEHESLYWPGSDASVRPGSRRTRPASVAEPPEAAVDAAASVSVSPGAAGG